MKTPTIIVMALLAGILSFANGMFQNQLGYERGLEEGKAQSEALYEAADAQMKELGVCEWVQTYSTKVGCDGR